MYSQKAFDILNSSINSAVFIDEKAKDFYSGTEINPDVVEEQLSFDLYTAFKKNGKNLTVHRFHIKDIDEPKTIEYLFKGKDLILLDWELNEYDGQEHSLNLLHKAVSSPNINFCCIYSSSRNFDTIPLYLDAYFSGLTKEQFETIKENYSHCEPQDLQNVINKNEDEILNFAKENEINGEKFPIDEHKDKSILYLIRLVYISLNVEKFFISDNQVSKYEVLNTGDDSFMINNTFVLTLKKDFTNDADYEKLLRRISDIVVNNEGSFFQLLGLEMQSIFNDNEGFIDNSILKSSTEALFQFRNHFDDDKVFGAVIKKLLIEHAALKFRTAKLKLLESDFLEDQSSKLASKTPLREDLFQLNVFHNSVTIRGMHDSIPNLNFGDIFLDTKGDYYLCVTALCDCYEPNKIQGNFYFVKGQHFKNIDLALKLGDTAFISFLPNNVAVYWGNLDSAKFDKIEKQKSGENIDLYRIRKLNNEIEGYKEFLYKPFYVKPQIFNVENNKLTDNKLRMWDISNKYTEDEIKQDLNEFNLKYITTLRNDYAQRIANHAFVHPARVGVNFVKIK